jgi:hypothetical protein
MTKIVENIKANKGYYIKDVEQIVDSLKTFADKCYHGLLYSDPLYELLMMRLFRAQSVFGFFFNVFHLVPDHQLIFPP